MIENEADSYSVLAGVPAFSVQVRGYSRQDVDDFLMKARQEARDLSLKIDKTREDARQKRADARMLGSRTDTGGSGSTGDAAQPAVGVQLIELLRDAEQDAGAQRAAAAEELRHARNTAVDEVEHFMVKADRRADRLTIAAEATAQDVVSTAMADAEELRASADRRADEIIGTATKSADTTVAEAKSRARFVNESFAGSAERLVSVRVEAVRALNSMSGSLGEILQSEKSTDLEAGARFDEVAGRMPDALPEGREPTDRSIAEPGPLELLPADAADPEPDPETVLAAPATGPADD